MQRRKRNVYCCPGGLPRRRSKGAGERTIVMDKKTVKRNLETSKVIYVQWVDAVADAGWEDEVKAEIDLCHTVGFLISETKDALCIASTVSKDNSNARIHIPKAWIKKRKVIKFETTVSKSKRKKATAVGERPDTPTIPYAEH